MIITLVVILFVFCSHASQSDTDPNDYKWKVSPQNFDGRIGYGYGRKLKLSLELNGGNIEGICLRKGRVLYVLDINASIHIPLYPDTVARIIFIHNNIEFRMDIEERCIGMFPHLHCASLILSCIQPNIRLFHRSRNLKR